MKNIFLFTLGELGTLGDDGNAWAVLSDGAAVDITPSVTPDMDYYDFGIMEGKHPITITANGHDLESTNTPEFCVGQNVVFSLDGIPSSNAPQGSWSIPGNYVNEEYVYSYNYFDSGDGTIVQAEPLCISYKENDDLLKTPIVTTNWFIDKVDNGAVTADFTYTMNNGQSVTVSKTGHLNVYKPSVSWEGKITGQVEVNSTNFNQTGTWLHFGNPKRLFKN